ncbi:type II toxin-antitoxin system PemK/MazF family toxin [Streptosporangium sp. NBC_01755]|uniref:type II toxin-antitoxin system PemK/MazF family toxin n=1 Tax=Streptosporangium sp. NBC_01755 TaxID=2975949 RepID=UPI002DDC3284|nr:type II toxin-antitoxin system PemK/MazF family toxin [Streptosporangium sp. NBC_01755]WSC97513.1 type II toxin-antitoxin system PemK/MazF family toxin [Streptosporangium sp. NBC_01755]
MPHPSDPPKRGEIYWVDHNPARGSEQAGMRPGVIISRDSFNSRMRVVVVAAMTSQVKPSLTKVAVMLPRNQPLKKEGQILSFQIMTIDKARLGGYMGCLDKNQIEDLKESLRFVWDL